MNWFYESGGQQQGPVTDEELDRLIAEGKVTQATLVWKEGQANWLPLREARPSPAPTGMPGVPAVPASDTVRCDSCGNQVPRANVVQIGNRNICATCKPAVLQQLQQGSDLPTYGAARTGPPWENRDTLGYPTAIWETIRGVLLEPSETFSNMRREGGLSSPLLYIVITGTVGFIANMAYQFLVQSAMGHRTQFGQMFLASGIGLLAVAVLSPVLVAVGSFIWAGIMHVSLMLCSGTKQPFETTYRVLAYAYGSGYALNLIPICGAYVGGIWALVSTCIGMAKAHEITVGRAVLSVLLPFILCCGIILLFAFFAGIAASQSHH